MKAAPTPYVVRTFPSHEAAIEFMDCPDDFNPGSTVIRCEWVESDGEKNGYYEKLADGTFACTVSNESELFATEQEVRDFLYSRI